MNKAREITYAFLKLPYHVRINIMDKFNIMSEEDKNIKHDDNNSIKLFTLFFRKIAQNNKVEELWKEIQGQRDKLNRK